MKDLFAFIQGSPTAFHTVQQTAQRLTAQGYTPLQEGQEWQLQRGKKYFVVRGASSLLAFVPPRAAAAGWRMAAAHSDSPCFLVKGVSVRQGCVMLNTEGYGGALRGSWLDRPLGIAGRVFWQAQGGLHSSLIAPNEDLALMPSLAIHMDRTANENQTFDAKKHTQALFSVGETGEEYWQKIATAAGCEAQQIVASDLFLYCRQRPSVLGGGLLAAPRLDDLACAWAGLQGLLAAGEGQQGRVLCLFDAEEVGSGTANGALSDFLAQTLARIADCLGESPQQHRMSLAKSFLLSADNAHATHPNFADYADPHNPVRMGGGVAIKRNANQKYTTTGETEAWVRALCAKAGVAAQTYYNRPDLAGGSTLGNLLARSVSVAMADVGIAQLAMHSCVETAALADITALQKLMTALYEG